MSALSGGLVHIAEPGFELALDDAELADALHQAA